MACEQVCRHCQAVRTPPIEGPCPICRGFYRTILKRVQGGAGEGGADDDERPEGPVPVGDLLDEALSDPIKRLPTGMSGLDHVLGGGMPEVGAVLFSGTAGSGKTSLLVEALLRMRIRSLLISTEQSERDLMAQFLRFGEDRFRRAHRYMSVQHETDFDEILDVIRAHKPRLLVLDSLQDINNDTMIEVCRAAKTLRRLSRELGFFAFLVGHMNNQDLMMGGAHLRHAVDGLLLLDRLSESDKDPRRILRFRGKVRFAELGREALFRMTEEGFEDCGPLKNEKDKDPPPTGGRPKLRVVN
jgi:DNA repair protein RadA/Sms